MAIPAPIVEISSGSITSPTRTTTIPIAKPMGYIVGLGRCACCSGSGLGCSGSTNRSLIGNAFSAKGELADRVLVPTACDELLDLRGHLDLLGPGTRAF